jgi:hypothetical protein
MSITFIQLNNWMWIETGHSVPYRFQAPGFIQPNSWMKPGEAICLLASLAFI